MPPQESVRSPPTAHHTVPRALQGPFQLRAPLLACLALLAAATAATAAETVDVGHCQATLWSSLPLAKQNTPTKEFIPNSQDYHKEWTLKHVLPPAVFCAISAALLVALLLWRLAKFATCVRCLRGPRHCSRAAGELLGARSMRWLKAAVVVLAVGMIAGAGFGFSTIHPKLEPAGIAVYDRAKVGQATEGFSLLRAA